jgi:EAL domain-containing protein (putative c-di-GMP-specific phosphodiesterase class I)
LYDCQLATSVDADRTLNASGRRRLLALLTLLALVIGVAAVFGVTSITEEGVIQTAERSAINDAELVSQVAFAGAISDGRLTRADLLAGEAQLAAARRTLDIRRVIAWGPGGRILYSNHPVPRRSQPPSHVPPLVRQAMRTDQTQAATGVDHSGNPEFSAAVPLGAPGRRLVAEFSFPRAAVQGQIDHIKRELYLAAGIGALLLYAALVALIARIAQRLPTRAERRREGALTRLAAALDHDELRLHFQPKFSIGLDDVLGVEALVRWEHPERGLLPPSEFVPLLETSHLLDRFTMAVLDSATEACRRWRAEGVDVPVAVNISAPALAGHDLAGQVAEALGRSGIPPAMLTLEITESAVMSAGPDATGTLCELRQMGIAIAIDDFGTGHSSLRRLGSLPLDELKIDRSFVTALGSDEHAVGVLRLIIDLGRQMGLCITAEGVETHRELEQLAGLGCDAVQGFLLAPPMAEHELVRLLAAGRGDGRLEVS